MYLEMLKNKEFNEATRDVLNENLLKEDDYIRVESKLTKESKM